jgi:hypothetical protein
MLKGQLKKKIDANTRSNWSGSSDNNRALILWFNFCTSNKIQALSYRKLVVIKGQL